MNTAVQEIARELDTLRAQIRERGGIATRGERKQLREMRARLVLARKGITA